MKVLVCGGRYYDDKARVFVELNMLRPDILIHGDAPGADSFAQEWSEGQGVHVWRFPAAWDFHGKRAGPIRNQLMLDEGQPDIVLAFPGGRGTADMVRRARQAGVKVIQITDSQA